MSKKHKKFKGDKLTDYRLEIAFDVTRPLTTEERSKLLQVVQAQLDSLVDGDIANDAACFVYRVSLGRDK